LLQGNIDTISGITSNSAPHPAEKNNVCLSTPPLGKILCCYVLVEYAMTQRIGALITQK